MDDATAARLREKIKALTMHLIVAQAAFAAGQAVEARKQSEAHMAEQKPLPKRTSLALLSRVINSTGREQEDEAAALIKRRQKNHARFLELAAKGHANEKLRETMLAESEREQQLDDLEAAVGGNGGPTLDAEPDEATKKVRAELDAAKSSGNASDGDQGEGQQ